MLDEIIHQVIRTRIMAYLFSCKKCDFSTLKKSLDLSVGHMSTHMKTLLGSGYIQMSKSFVNDKPRTTYEVTQKEAIAFKKHINELKNIIES